MALPILNNWHKLSDSKKSAFVFTIALLITKGIAILTTPIFTRIMSTSDIGLVGIYTSWASMLGVVISLGLTSGGFYIGLKDFATSRNQYVSSILSLTSIGALVASVTFIICPHFWGNILGLPTSLIILMLIGFFLGPSYEMWLGRQRYENKYSLPAKVTIFTGIGAAIAAILTVLYMGEHNRGNLAEGRLFATYGVTYAVYLVFFITIFAKGKTFFNKKFWKSSLILSTPLVGHAFASQVLSVSDRMMIDKMTGTADVGIYTVLYSVGTLSLILWNAINHSYVPYLFQNIDSKEKKREIAKSASLILIGFSGVVILISLLAPEIVNILATENYLRAVRIVPPIVAGIYLTSVANFYSNVLIYAKNTVMIMVSTCVAAAVNVGLNLIFIPMYGFEAAAYTTLVSYIAYALMQAISANVLFRRYSGRAIVYSNSGMFIIASLTVVACILSSLTYQYDIIRYGLILILAAGTLAVLKKHYDNKTVK